MSDQYKPIYSDVGRLKNRVQQLTTGMTAQVLAYQQYIDGKINNRLRATLGSYDQNGFYISLPLIGNYDTINIPKMLVTLHMDYEIQMAADDCVIAYFRRDTAENEDKLKIAEATLMEVIANKYGNAVSVDHDFTTDFLAADKVLSNNNGVIALFNGNGVLLSLAQATGKIPASNNPDSRVIFVPGPPL